jgi:hypothetical protein
MHNTPTCSTEISRLLSHMSIVDRVAERLDCIIRSQGLLRSSNHIRAPTGNLLKEQKLHYILTYFLVDA